MPADTPPLLPPYDYKTKEYERYTHAVLSGGDFTVELTAAVTASARFVHDDQPVTPPAHVHVSPCHECAVWEGRAFTPPS